MFQLENKYGINNIIIPITRFTLVEYSNISNREEYISIGCAEKLSFDNISKIDKYRFYYLCKSLKINLQPSSQNNCDIDICISYNNNLKSIENPLLNSFPYKHIISDLNNIGMVFNEKLLKMWIKANIIKFIKNDTSIYFSEQTKVYNDFSEKTPVRFMHHVNHSEEFQFLKNAPTTNELLMYVKENFINAIKTKDDKSYELLVPNKLFGNYLNGYIKSLKKTELSFVRKDIILENYIDRML